MCGEFRANRNALMQYLKRKRLVEKTGPEFDAPYSLTDEGRAALAEMTRRLASAGAKYDIAPSS
jgi:hypothetical protein